MRRILTGSALLLGGACASQSVDDTQAVDRACSVSECFYHREIRDFEVIGDDTLIVYVGGQRCAFQVQLDGALCDMSFAPELYFRFPERNVDEQRVCAYDTNVGVDGGVFTEDEITTSTRLPGGRRTPDPFDRSESAIGGITNRQTQCRIRSVASITDDELVELYVQRGVVPPPPPMGAGQIVVGEQDAEDETAEQGDPGAAATSERERTNEEAGQPIPR